MSSQCDFTTIKQLVKGYRISWIKSERNGEPLFVIDVILFLSKQNLSFRDHREDLRLKVAIVKTLTQGNFLETVKIIAESNPVMNEHLSDIQVRYRKNACQHTFLRLYNTSLFNVLEEKRKILF